MAEQAPLGISFPVLASGERPAIRVRIPEVQRTRFLEMAPEIGL
jgi:hypothetical protein